MATPFNSLRKTRKVPLRQFQGTPSNGRFPPGATDTAVYPTDHDLISLLASKFSTAEANLRLQSKELADKNMKIQMLEEKISLLSMRKDDTKKTEIDEKYLQLQRQVLEMEEFLADYGLVWVGSSDQDHSDDSDGDAAVPPGEGGWKQSSSIPLIKKYIDFDLLVARIRELNVICGEGVFKVERTVDGARLKAPEPVNFVLYSNGIVLFNGPFRPFSDPATQHVIRDILDGYFPAELQNRYPDGIPFKTEELYVCWCFVQLSDRRNVHFTDVRSELFDGVGKPLGGSSVTSRLVSNIHGLHALQSSSTNDVQEETELPVPKLTIDQFLNKLPSSVIKNGQVIDIRRSVQERLRPNPVISKAEEIDCRKQADDVQIRGRHPFNEQCISLRIVSEDGDDVVVLKMNENNTIGDVRKQLDDRRKSRSKHYSIISAFPHRLYADDGATLLQCGLTSNATLHLRQK